MLNNITDVETAKRIIRESPRGPYKILGYVEVNGARMVRIGYTESGPTGDLVECVVFLAIPDAARYIVGSSDPRYGWAALLAGPGDGIIDEDAANMAQTIADEAFGPHESMSMHQNLLRIERGIADLRQTVARYDKMRELACVHGIRPGLCSLCDTQTPTREPDADRAVRDLVIERAAAMLLERIK